MSVDLSISMIYTYSTCFGDKYHSQWHFNNENKCWKGNLCCAAEVGEMLEVYKHKSGAEGEHNHSWAMTLPDMEKLFTHSRNTCPAVSDHDSIIMKVNLL